jgi:hypothetical protein
LILLGLAIGLVANCTCGEEYCARNTSGNTACMARAASAERTSMAGSERSIRAFLSIAN